MSLQQHAGRWMNAGCSCNFVMAWRLMCFWSEKSGSADETHMLRMICLPCGWSVCNRAELKQEKPEWTLSVCVLWLTFWALKNSNLMLQQGWSSITKLFSLKHYHFEQENRFWLPLWTLKNVFNIRNLLFWMRFYSEKNN